MITRKRLLIEMISEMFTQANEIPNDECPRESVPRLRRRDKTMEEALMRGFPKDRKMNTNK